MQFSERDSKFALRLRQERSMFCAPVQRDCCQTVIDVSKVERWFCPSAGVTGWRAAQREPRVASLGNFPSDGVVYAARI